MPSCESRVHGRGLYGHVPEESASYLVYCPCGASFMCCAGRVRTFAVTVKPTLVLCLCNGEHPSSEFRWTTLEIF